MNIKKLLVLAPIGVLSLTSCGSGKTYNVEEYKVLAKHARYDGNKGLKILQLTDLHLGTNCDREVQYKFIQKTIDLANQYAGTQNDGHKAKVDMIIITGDVFTFGNREIVEDFCNFMEKQKIDWTMTFGNHDEQCYFSIDWLTGYLNDLSKKEDSYLLFKDLQDDDVFGNANFFIDVPNEPGATQSINERMYIIDSNRYKYTLSSCGYDNIHEDQVKWYERCCEYKYNFDKASDIHSLAFFHIPFEQFNTYHEEAKKTTTDKKAEFVKDEDGETLDKQKEGISCSKVTSRIYEAMNEKGSTKGVFVGHDHINNSAVKIKENDMILSFGVKGTDTVYADDDIMGGQIITVKERENKKETTIHSITHKYSDLEAK